jgi:hypothetical protein
MDPATVLGTCLHSVLRSGGETTYRNPTTRSYFVFASANASRIQAAAFASQPADNAARHEFSKQRRVLFQLPLRRLHVR